MKTIVLRVQAEAIFNIVRHGLPALELASPAQMEPLPLLEALIAVCIKYYRLKYFLCLCWRKSNTNDKLLKCHS